ncbi:ParB/RepB/Spo0J family partition protein [Actinokineospora iranica]|uniref:Chromosome segregation protein Spo0J, contains ParB-like nuclease domain n=1 Tax=Actinokineospora iranica TaxID=1271860 RepID=A0A1G6VPT0_9PSEU|nr:hypothetical protein [Actinokineospora iranica]SDD55551.1 Chromosome segregation protein Spo0J, contains ParB-like nuclease domain [Actinokineospora iranica]
MTAIAPVLDEPTSDDAEASYPYIANGVDPRTLRVDGNSRQVGDIRAKRPDLVDSIARHGVDPKVSIINVTPDQDGVLHVLVGFHRTAAAVAVKDLENPDLLVDVLVHAPGSTRRETLIAQGIENLHREGYTQLEEAELYRQLALEGLADDDIAAELSRPIDRVRAGRAVAESARTADAAEALPQIDLFELGELADFADDEDLHSQLVEILQSHPAQFEHALGRARRIRDQARVEAEETIRLTELGYLVLDDEQDLDECHVLPLDELCDGQDPTPLDPAEHEQCPGRAVTVRATRELEVELEHYCTDYTAHGHHTVESMKVAAEEAALRDAGVTVIDPDTPGATPLGDLRAQSDSATTLRAEDHVDCPGHAAYVGRLYSWSKLAPIYVCTDHLAHGHVLLSAARTPHSARSAEWQKAERARTKKNNDAWADAKTDRRAWLATFFKGWRKADVKKLPKRLQHWLALAPILASDHLADAAPGHVYACTLLSIKNPGGGRFDRDSNPLVALLNRKTTTDAQALWVRLAQVVGAGEAHWSQQSTERNADLTWRRPSRDTVFYFQLLEVLGYPLSHIEKVTLDATADAAVWPHLAEDDKTDDGTEDTTVTEVPQAA